MRNRLPCCDGHNRWRHCCFSCSTRTGDPAPSISSKSFFSSTFVFVFEEIYGTAPPLVKRPEPERNRWYCRLLSSRLIDSVAAFHGADDRLRFKSQVGPVFMEPDGHLLNANADLHPSIVLLAAPSSFFPVPASKSEEQSITSEGFRSGCYLSQPLLTPQVADISFLRCCIITGLLYQCNIRALNGAPSLFNVCNKSKRPSTIESLIIIKR